MNKYNLRIYSSGRKRRALALKLSETMSYEDIGKKLGITKQRVSQIIRQALKDRE